MKLEKQKSLLSEYEHIFFAPLLAGMIHFEASELPWTKSILGNKSFKITIDPNVETNKETAARIKVLKDIHSTFEHTATIYLQRGQFSDIQLVSSFISDVLDHSKGLTVSLPQELDTGADEFCEKINAQLLSLESRNLISDLTIYPRNLDDENPRPYFIMTFSNAQNVVLQKVFDEVAECRKEAQQRKIIGPHTDNIIKLDFEGDQKLLDLNDDRRAFQHR